MIKKALTSSIFAISLLSATCSAFAQWVDIRDPEELRDMMSDRQTIVTTEDGIPWNRSLNKRNGTSFSTSPKGLEWTREWVVKGDQVCITDHLRDAMVVTTCRTYQRHATIKGQYRSTMVEDGGAERGLKIPKILFIKVTPTPDYRKSGIKAVG